MNGDRQLSGTNDESDLLRVMLVEDDFLIGMDLAMFLEEWGYKVDGPHGSSTDAMAAIDRGLPDLAILDVNLGFNDTSFPVAEALHHKGRPFVFLTGYDPARYSGNKLIEDAPHLRKPVNERELREVLAEFAQQVRV